MYAIYGNIYHQYTPNVSIYTIHGSYGLLIISYKCGDHSELVALRIAMAWRTHFDSDGDAELDFKDILPPR